jgi:hypothetical protein
MPADVVEHRRERSAALFNNRYFVDVVTAIGQLVGDTGDLVTTRQVASATGLADSLVRPVMLRLEAARLMTRLPRIGSTRGPQYFAIRSGDTWAHMAALVRDVSTATS